MAAFVGEFSSRTSLIFISTSAWRFASTSTLRQPGSTTGRLAALTQAPGCPTVGFPITSVPCRTACRRRPCRERASQPFAPGAPLPAGSRRPTNVSMTAASRSVMPTSCPLSNADAASAQSRRPSSTVQFLPLEGYVVLRAWLRRVERRPKRVEGAETCSAASRAFRVTSNNSHVVDGHALPGIQTPHPHGRRPRCDTRRPRSPAT